MNLQAVPESQVKPKREAGRGRRGEDDREGNQSIWRYGLE